MSGAPILTLHADSLDPIRLEALLQDMARGDQEAFGQFYSLTHPAVFGFALSILRSSHDAEDAAQETFVHAYLGAAQYRPAGKPMAWLLTITKHLAYEKRRSDGRVTELPDGAWLDAAEEYISHEERLVLQAALQSLTEEERQIVTLHAVAGFKHRETAALLELALPTVLSKYHRALKKLRATLKERDKHD